MRYQVSAQGHIRAWQSNAIQRITKEQLTILSETGELTVVVNKNIYVSLWFILAMCFPFEHFREVYPACEMVSGPLIKVSLLLRYLLQVAAVRLFRPFTNLKALVFWIFCLGYFPYVFCVFIYKYISLNLLCQ